MVCTQQTQEYCQQQMFLTYANAQSMLWRDVCQYDGKVTKFASRIRLLLGRPQVGFRYRYLAPICRPASLAPNNDDADDDDDDDDDEKCLFFIAFPARARR